MIAVAVLLPNRPETVTAYLACFKANFVIVPLDYRHPAAQVGYALSHSGADVLIVHHDRVAELEEAGLLNSLSNVIVVGEEPEDSRYQSYDDLVRKRLPQNFPDDFDDQDLSVMIYTSGTTSRPKGVTLTRKAIATGIQKYLARVTLDRQDVGLVAAPITRPMALRCQLLPLLFVGGCVCLLERFQADEYVESLKRGPSKTYLSLLPTALRRVIRHPEFANADLTALRLCMSGGDRVPQDLHAEFKEKTGIEITEQCGASEVGPYALNPPFGRKKPGSIGLPMYGAQVCVFDTNGRDTRAGEIGEIYVNSPLMMDGYWNDTALTRKTLRDGWLRTGDLGRFDDDGFLWFMGRKKDIIVRGGSNISPLEVEAVLLHHEEVAEACVIGLLDLQWGQVPHAFVVPVAGATVTSDELLEFCQQRLAAYMVPEAIQLLESLPVKGPGKINRDLLRMRAEIRPLIEKVPFFQNVSEDFIRDIVPRLECLEFDEGETIFRQGELGRAMFFLTRGRVGVVQEGENGSRKSLGDVTEGNYFGELAVLKEAPRSASISALEDCEVFELKRVGVLELADKYPEFAAHLREAQQSYSDL